MMPSVYLALVGLAVGLLLDALIVRLAVAPDEDNEDVAPEGEDAGPAGGARRPSVHAEAGAFVLEATPAQAWGRRLLVALATAGLFALVADRYDELSHVALVCAYVSVLIVCTATDLLTYRVPNAVTYPAIVGAFVVAAIMPDANLLEAVAGGALAGGILFLPALLTGGVGVGMGDVKLAAFVGLALGFVNVVPALIVMALAGGLAALILLIARLRRRGEPIPYAPFIAVGAIAALLWRGTGFVALS